MALALTQLEHLILAALSRLDGRGTATAICRTIRSDLGRSASIGHVYVAFGALAERRLLKVRAEAVRRNGRDRMQSVAELTGRGRLAARSHPVPLAGGCLT